MAKTETAPTTTDAAAPAPADKKARKQRFTVSLALTPELSKLLDDKANEAHSPRANVALKILAAGFNYTLPEAVAKAKAPKLPKDERKIVDAGRRAHTLAIMAAIERGEMVNPADFPLDKYIAAARTAAATKATESKPAETPAATPAAA